MPKKKPMKVKRVRPPENRGLTRVSFPLGQLGNGELARLTGECLAQLVHRVAQRRDPSPPADVALLTALMTARQLIRCDGYEDDDEG